MCNSIVCLENRLKACKTLDDYRLLIGSCSIALTRHIDLESQKVIYGILQKCVTNCLWILNSED